MFQVLSTIVATGAAVEACSYAQDSNCGVAVTIAVMGVASTAGMKLMEKIAPETFSTLGRVVRGGEGQYWILNVGFTVSGLGGGGGGA